MFSFILKVIFIYLLITFIMFIYRFYKTIQGVKKQMRGEGQADPFGGPRQEGKTKRPPPKSNKADIEAEYTVIKEE